MTVGQLGMKHPSLASMVEAIKVKMSREGMHRRFSVGAVAFMKRCSDFILKQKISTITSIRVDLLRHFKRILIFDSSSWNIHPKLKDVLPGCGGSASEANCKLQTCYEYKRGELSFFEITSGITPDGAYTYQLPGHVQRGDLVLVDLGYFNIKIFHQICVIGAYFLSRLSIGIRLFDSKTFSPIDLLGVLKTIKGDIHEMQIIVGGDKETQVCCRLICLRVSQEVANARRRKLKKTSRERGRTPSQYHLLLADWTLMITNVPQQWLPPEMVRPFYSLRWQIELLFKQIKTVLRIHKSNTGRVNRLCCEIYGKMIMAVMIHRIHAFINIRLWNSKRKELSMEKLYKRIQERAFIILDLLLVSLQRAIDYLQEEIPRLIKNCLKSLQRSRRTTLEIIEYGPLTPKETVMLDAA
jgi:hypothetical protein